jgi:hypothetical protein
MRAERLQGDVAGRAVDDCGAGTHPEPPGPGDVAREPIEYGARHDRRDRRHGQGIFGVCAAPEKLTGQRRPMRFGVDAGAFDAVQAWS